MGFFNGGRKLKALRDHVDYLDRQINHLYEYDHYLQEKNEKQRDQIETLRRRSALSETILMNVLARNVNCIVGWDYYLDQLQEIRKTDTDSNPNTR
jgi:hypothetical protein